MTRTDPIAAAAAEALAAADGDAAKATKLMAEAVRADGDLRDALTEPLINGACYDAIRKQCQAQRRHIWTAPNYTTSGNGQRVGALAAGNLLMFPLPGGMRLGEATRVEIADAAGFYQRQADDMALKGRWLTLVAQSVPYGKKVAEVLTNERLSDLRDEAAGMLAVREAA